MAKLLQRILWMATDVLSLPFITERFYNIRLQKTQFNILMCQYFFALRLTLTLIRAVKDSTLNSNNYFVSAAGIFLRIVCDSS